MSIIKKNNGIKFLWISLIAIVLDQLTKYLVVHYIPLTTSILANQPFFSLIHVYNEGAAWSFLSSMGGWQRYFFMFIAITISALLVLALLRTDKEKKWSCIAIALVIGGAIGNCIDRAVLSHVVDFILIHFQFNDFSYFYPAFNVADIAVCVGAFILVVIGFFGHEDQKDNK